MSSTSISPLRQRMLEDMKIRGYTAHTQRDYVRAVADFAQFINCSPEWAEPEDLRRYQLHLANQGVSPATMNSRVSGLRLLFSGHAREAKFWKSASDRSRGKPSARSA